MAIDCRTAPIVVLCDERSDVELAHLSDEVVGVITLVDTRCYGAAWSGCGSIRCTAARPLGGERSALAVTSLIPVLCSRATSPPRGAASVSRSLF